MKRAQVLGSSATPLNVFPRTSRDRLEPKFSRGPLQPLHIRPKSTVQFTRLWEENSVASTVFGGGSLTQKFKAPTGKYPSFQPPIERPRQLPTKASPVHGRTQVEILPKKPSAQQRHKASSLNVNREDFVQENIYVPTQNDYPDLPGKIFTNPRRAIEDALKNKADIKTEFSEVGQKRRGCSHRCRVACEFPEDNVRVTAVGHDSLKRKAEEAAYLNLLAQFHKREILLNIFLDSKHWKFKDFKHTGAVDIVQIKTDIYNYCARFDSVPVITCQVVEKKDSRGKIEIRIALPQQGISGEGMGTQYRLAEIGAALRFKRAAEEYQAQHGKEPIVIQDSTSLTVGNSKKFLLFYKVVHRNAQIRSDFTHGPGTKVFGSFGGDFHQCQLFINEKPTGDAVVMATKKSAEDVAYLTAAVGLKAREPELHPQFLKAWKEGHGNILRPLSPIDMEVDGDSLFHMRQTLIKARMAGLPDELEEQVSSKEDLETTGFRRHPHLTRKQAKMRDMSMQKAFGAYLQDPSLDKLRRARSELPVSQYSAQVLDLIKNHTYCIIFGATGSGKTTQVPQIILEDAISKGEGSACNIVCTQPRKIAATSVARRVSEERGEELQNTVGYQVRFQAKLPKASGSITFCTTGIVLKQLQYSPDVIMEDVSHLIIDEVHERDILTDFLLVMLKKIMQQRAAAGRSTPKVVLMSATMNTQLLASYFSRTTAEGVKVDCPTLTVPGRAFPVKEKYLPDIVEELRTAYPAEAMQIIEDDSASRDYLAANKSFLVEQSKMGNIAASRAGEDDESIIDWKQEKRFSSEGNLVNFSTEKDDSLVPYGLVVTTIAHIANQSDQGAVLVFLPGLKDIVKVDELLRRRLTFGVNFNDESKFQLHMLHSSIGGTQTEVFNPVPLGCRKVILSTNIAETSVTIPDVRYVIDTGKLNEKQYDQVRRITELKCTWISKSNSKQRAGRAGRVQNGHYYALFPRERYESLRAIGLPEMLRTDLQEVCLDIKAQAFQSPIRDFLASALEPPSTKAVDLSIQQLQALEAIRLDETITPLGRVLASLPVHPSLGKMILLGVIFRCLDPLVVLGAAHSERELFNRPLDMRQQAYEKKLFFVQDSASDHIAVLNAVREMRGLRGSQQRDYAMQNFIHVNTYKNIENTARQIETILAEAGIIQHAPPLLERGVEIGSASLNRYSHKVSLIKALLLAGLHPNLAVHAGGRTYRTPGEEHALPHSSSANRIKIRSKDLLGHHGVQLLSYSIMSRLTDKSCTTLRETSESTPLMAILFGGKIRTDFRRRLEMDQWLTFFVKSPDVRALKIIFEFRKALERLLLMTFRRLTMKRNPENGDSLNSTDEYVRDTFAQGLVDVLDRDSWPRKYY